MSSLTYKEKFTNTLEQFHQGLSKDMNLILTMPDQSAEEVVKYLLSLACEASHISNIILGRQALISMPRHWLIERIENWSKPLLETNDEWVFRRLLELYVELDKELANRLIRRGELSPNEDIRECATSFVLNNI